MKLLLLLVSLAFTVKAQAQTVTDIDGNTYNSIVIGSQTWMQENLKVVRYQNGDSITTTIPTSKDIGIESNPKYQWPYNGVDSNANTYGRLYTWHAAVDNRNVCPTNWHLPSVEEWDTLISTLGGVNNAKTQMLTGSFSAIYSGRRHADGFYGQLNNQSLWWSSDNFPMNSVWKPSITVNSNSLTSYGNLFRTRSLGFSIRCIKDTSIVGIGDNVRTNNTYIIIDNLNNKILVRPKNISNPILYIFNSSGRIVLQKIIKNDTVQIDFNDFLNGIYISKLIGDNFYSQRKWMKLK